MEAARGRHSAGRHRRHHFGARGGGLCRRRGFHRCRQRRHPEPRARRARARLARRAFRKNGSRFSGQDTRKRLDGLRKQPHIHRQEESMNKPIAAAELVTPRVTTGPIAGSRKIYSTPEAAPDLRVPLREIALDASSGEPPLPVYDTTGPYTDPDAKLDVEKGLSRSR